MGFPPLPQVAEYVRQHAAAMGTDPGKYLSAIQEAASLVDLTRNPFLLNQLRLRCHGMVVRPLAELGIGDMEREALAFALLAWWQVRNHPGSLPSVTGASGPAVLGVRANPPGEGSRFSVREGA